MFQLKKAALLAAGALLISAGLVRAAEPTAILSQPLMLAETGPAATSIMGVADKFGLAKPLTDNNITIGGWVQGGWTYNFDEPTGAVNAGRVFDFEDQDLTFHQAVIYVEKSVTPDGKKFDIGGRMEWMWGGDARLIHSNGLFDHYGLNDGPDEQFDLTQAYIDINLPVGNGLKLRAGKFVTPIGYEYINPNLNPLYSHSYLFGFAIPFTHTGLTATYAFNDSFTAYAGITRGWEQSLEDNNDSIDVLAGFTWTIDKRSSLFVNVSGGPQQANNDDYRYLIDATYTIKVSDELTLAVNGDFAWEENAGNDGDDATWYGVAGYATYNFGKGFALQGRAEYFNDEDGARGIGTSVYELTIGLNIKPLESSKDFASLQIRPEIRWDMSSDDFFDGGRESSQITFGVDVLFAI